MLMSWMPFVGGGIKSSAGSAALSTGETEEVNMTSVDIFIKHIHQRPVDLIKIDTEGNDNKVRPL